MVRATIQRLLVAAILVVCSGMVAQARDPLPIEGTWVGSYRCGQGVTGLILTIEAAASGLTGTFRFHPTTENPRAQAGAYSVTGRFDPLIGELRLTPARWIEQPRGYGMVGLSGLLGPDGETLTGRIEHRSCQGFDLARSSGDVAASTIPTLPTPGTNARCEAALEWMNVAKREYPDLNMARSNSSILYPIITNAYRREHFEPIFGTAFEDLSVEQRADLRRNVGQTCGNHRDYAHFMSERASTFFFRPLTLESDQFSRSSFSRAEMLERLRNIDSVLTWRDRVLAAASGLETSEANFATVSAYAEQGEQELEQLWPSERAAFGEALGSVRKRMAETLIVPLAAEAEALPATLEGARRAAAIARDSEVYLAAIGDGADGVGRSVFADRITALLEPLVAEELATLETLAMDREGLEAAARWHGGFEGRFGEFQTHPAIERANLHYRNWRDTARRQVAAGRTSPSIEMSAETRAALGNLGITDDYARMIQALFLGGEAYRFTDASYLFLGGMADSLLAECGLPRGARQRSAIGTFLVGVSHRAALGNEYANPDLAGGMQRQIGGTAVFAAGSVAARSLGCTNAGEQVADAIIAAVESNAGGGAGGESLFVMSCQDQFNQRQCRCLADLGRGVIPNIHQTSYDRSVIPRIVSGNPLLAFQIGVTCNISNY